MADTNCRDEDYIIADDGRVAFTAEGRAFYTSYFGYAGIDIRRIRTKDDLYRASRAAFPYLFPFMAQRLKKRRQTLETRALLAIVESDWVSLDRIEAQLRTRERLKVVSGLRDAPPVPAAAP
jgi:hypothetical protein